MINYILENGREFREYVRHFTNAPGDHQARSSATPRTSTASSRAATPTTALYDVDDLGLRGTPAASSTAGKHEQAGRRLGRAGPRRARHDAARAASRRSVDCDAASTRAACSSSCSATSPATRPRWCERDLRRAARAVPAGRRGAVRELGPRAHVGASSTRSAGRSTRPASRTSAPPSIIQLLLGNIGRPGGGILALRGHANIQGSTDIPTLYDILPSYIPMPHPQSAGDARRLRRARTGPSTGAWGDLQRLHRRRC